MRVAFLLQDLQLSGGVGVVVEHASQLAGEQGFDITLAMTRRQDEPDWSYRGLDNLHVLPLEQARERRFDVALATWWETTYYLFDLKAERYAYFVQSMEDRFYRPEETEHMAAGLTYALPVHFVTEARWIADTLQDLQPGSRCFYVRNGIAKDVFSPPEKLDVRRSGPLRIMIEGDREIAFKGVEEAVAATGAMSEEREVTLVTPKSKRDADLPVDRIVGPLSQAEMARTYAETDVVLKLSRVEGMFGPPLEGFHLGATCVVTPVTGHDEYVVHGWNGLVADWDDARGTARQLDLLARDRRLLNFLRLNAINTARAWPSWQQSSQFMAGALQAIRRLPPPDPALGGARMAKDIQAAIELHRVQIAHRDRLVRQLHEIKRLRAYRVALFLRALARPLLAPARWLRRTVRGG